MLAEGVPPALIENVGRMAGMPVGPLALNDEVAVDLGLEDRQGDRGRSGHVGLELRQKAVLDVMVEKSGGSAARTARASTIIPRRAEEAVAGPGRNAADKLDPERSTSQEIKDRLLAMQALETARCFEEGVLTDVREADVGSILGFGFAPFSGGTLSYIDMMGVKKFVELCQRLEKKCGARFTPAKLLLDMAQKDERFYSRFAPGKKAA